MSEEITTCPECGSSDCSLTDIGIEQKEKGLKIIIMAETICDKGHVFMDSILSASGEKRRNNGFLI